MIVCAALYSGPLQVPLVHAGQHRDTDHLGVLCCRGLGIFKHCAATAGMNGDDGRLKHMDGLHRPGDRVGNVVELEIEKDRQAYLSDQMDAVRPMRAEELEPELDTANVALDLLGESDTVLEPGDIEGKVDRIGHAGFEGSGSTGLFGADAEVWP